MRHPAQRSRAGPLPGLTTVKASPGENQAGLGFVFSSIFPSFSLKKTPPLSLGKKVLCSPAGFLLGPALLTTAGGLQAEGLRSVQMGLFSSLSGLVLLRDKFLVDWWSLASRNQLFFLASRGRRAGEVTHRGGKYEERPAS